MQYIHTVEADIIQSNQPDSTEILHAAFGDDESAYLSLLRRTDIQVLMQARDLENCGNTLLHIATERGIEQTVTIRCGNKKSTQGECSWI